MKLFPLKIATPTGLLFEGEAYMLSVRGVDGDLAVLAGHVPFVTALKEGTVRLYAAPDAKPKTGRATGGILTVSEEGVTLLSADLAWQDA